MILQVQMSKYVWQYWVLEYMWDLYPTSGSINQCRSLTSYKVEHLLGVIHWHLYIVDKCLIWAQRIVYKDTYHNSKCLEVVWMPISKRMYPVNINENQWAKAIYKTQMNFKTYWVLKSHGKLH